MSCAVREHVRDVQLCGEVRTLEASRSSLPWPCSNMLGPAMRDAPSTSACFMLAGFSSAHLPQQFRRLNLVSLDTQGAMG